MIGKAVTWMTEEEINNTRMKAYLNFDEQEIAKDLLPPYEVYKYKNRKGDWVACRVLLRRDDGDVIVINTNGCQVCLTEQDLRPIHD